MIETFNILEEKRRRSILFYIYILCFFIFSIINIKNIYFNNKIEIIELGLISISLILISYFFLYKKKKYTQGAYALLFIIGSTIILAIIFNNFDNFMPLYLITFYLFSVVAVNLKKAILINLVFTILFLLMAYLNKDRLIDSQFLNNKLAIINFLIIVTLILSFLYFYEITRINNYKMLIESNNKKDFLYREIHHRVKNNLNMISSMMSMQFEDENDNVQNMIKITKDRINSIAMVHSMLYITNNIEKVDAQLFIKKITDNIIQSSTRPISTILKLENLELSLNEIIPVGLILNELISNSIKHAFKNTINPKIIIVLKEHKNNILLTFHDNGSSYNKNYEHNLGLKLVYLNTEQLEGKIKVKKQYGLSYKLSYKKKLYV